MEQPPGRPPVQYGLPVNNTPSPVILNTQPQSRVRDKYNVKSVKVLSIIQIVLGILAIIFQIWDIMNDTGLGVVGAGIWTGALIVSFLVMSIIASVFTIGLLVPSAVNIHIINTHVFNILWERGHYYEDDPTVPPRPAHLKDSYLERLLERRDVVAAISGILIFISLTEAVVALVSSCYACHGLCESKSQRGHVLIPGQGQYMARPNGHGIPLGVPQLHQAQAAAPTLPPPYSGRITPPPRYEEKENGLQLEGSK